MASKIGNFYPGTTKAFRFTISYDGTVQDISSDTCTFRMKRNITDLDTETVLSGTADVSTSGANGVAIFILSSTVTDKTPGTYYYDVEWAKSTGQEYIISSNTIELLDRVSDA